jgi:hypothetical protein
MTADDDIYLSSIEQMPVFDLVGGSMLQRRGLRLDKTEEVDWREK